MQTIGTQVTMAGEGRVQRPVAGAADATRALRKFIALATRSNGNGRATRMAIADRPVTSCAVIVPRQVGR
jgi:hypothetical protein